MIVFQVEKICNKMEEERQNLYTSGEMDQQPNGGNLQSSQQRNRTNFNPEQCDMLEKGAQLHFPPMFIFFHTNFETYSTLIHIS